MSSRAIGRPGPITRRTALALLGGSVAAGRGAAQTRYDLSHGYQAESVAGRAAEIFARRVSDASGAEMVVFPASKLMKSVDGFDALYAGGIAAWLGVHPATTRLAEMRLFDMPFLIRDTDHLRRAFEFGLVGRMRDFFAKQGLVLAAPIVTGAHVFSTSGRPILSPEDLEGMKLSVRGGALTSEGFAKLGASIVRLPTAELYPALQAGFLEGVATPLDTVLSARLYEVHNYLSLTRHVHGVAFLVLNERSADEIDRGLVQEIGDALAMEVLDLAAAADLELIDNLRERGMEVAEVDTDRFEIAKKLAYDLYLNDAPEAWDMLSLIEEAAYF